MSTTQEEFRRAMGCFTTDGDSRGADDQRANSHCQSPRNHAPHPHTACLFYVHNAVDLIISPRWLVLPVSGKLIPVNAAIYFGGLVYSLRFFGRWSVRPVHGLSLRSKQLGNAHGTYTFTTMAGHWK